MVRGDNYEAAKSVDFISLSVGLTFELLVNLVPIGVRLFPAEGLAKFFGHEFRIASAVNTKPLISISGFDRLVPNGDCPLTADISVDDVTPFETALVHQLVGNAFPLEHPVKSVCFFGTGCG